MPNPQKKAPPKACISTNIHSRYWIYCFKRGDKAVMLNRWDETVKEFDTFAEAVIFCDENEHLIDTPISKKARSYAKKQGFKPGKTSRLFIHTT